MKPRDYQIAAVESVWQYWQSGKKGNPIIILPTGTGKSGVAAWIIKRALYEYPTTRVLVLTHVKELIKNNYETLLRVWPAAPAGIYSAGLSRKDIGRPVTFAGIASIRTRAALFRNTDLIIIDECHRVSDDESASYSKFIAELRIYNPKLKVIGLTATAFRMGLGVLTDGLLFDDVCFDCGSGEAFLWMLEQGYLCRIAPKKTKSTVNVLGVKTSQGEYDTKALEARMDEQHIIEDAIEESIERASDRRSWLVFTTSIEKAEQIAQMYRERGLTAAAVHSKLPGKERDKALEDFKAGRLRIVVNKDVLTTGFDHPGLDCIIMLRPSKSPGLWVQMLGRGTRPFFAPGFDLNTQEGRLASIAASPKQNCLMLDFAGNTERLGPINYPTIPKMKGAGGGEPPTRVCPECGELVHISVRTCPDCGYVFPVKTKLSSTASSTEVILDLKNKPEPVYGVFVVDRMMAVRHIKAGVPDSMRVDYYCGVRRFTEWVGVEHRSPYMRQRAKEWWHQHCPVKNDPLPIDTDGMLASFPEVRKPSHIRVLLNQKYPEIVAYDFTNTGFDPAAFTQQIRLDGGAGTRPDTSEDSGADRGVPALQELFNLRSF